MLTLSTCPCDRAEAGMTPAHARGTCAMGPPRAASAFTAPHPLLSPPRSEGARPALSSCSLPSFSLLPGTGLSRALLTPFIFRLCPSCPPAATLSCTWLTSTPHPVLLWEIRLRASLSRPTSPLTAAPSSHFPTQGSSGRGRSRIRDTQVECPWPAW